MENAQVRGYERLLKAVFDRTGCCETGAASDENFCGGCGKPNPASTRLNSGAFYDCAIGHPERLTLADDPYIGFCVDCGRFVSPGKVASVAH